MSTATLPRRAPLALALAFLAAGCAASTPPGGYGYRQPQAPAEPYKSIVMQASYKEVQTQLEPVSATCWLDDELQAANLLVDRATGDVSFFSDEGKILTADIVPIRGNVTEVRLIGEVMEAPGRHTRMRNQLKRAVERGTVTC